METIIYVIISICAVLAVALLVVLVYVWKKDKKNINGASKVEEGANTQNSQTRLQGIESMSKFLDFDEIVDSMIVRKNRQQYVMVIHCKGVNYDLLGEEEKLAVENGFVQFLNTLRFPVQLYVQTRSLNLKDSIDQYTSKIEAVKEDIIKLDAQIKKEKANGRLDLVRRLELNRKRKMNILEYGVDVTNYVARMSQNRNVLQQNTYVAVAYYTSEFGGEIQNYSKEEVDNIAFSELYTRAQTLIRALSSSGVTGKVINSEELAELLYIAYNRDDSELINIRRSVDAQYDSLYNTAKDTLDKQKQMIEENIEKEAITLTANSITKADQVRRLKQERKEEIKRRAMQYVEMYKNEMTDDLYDETKRQIQKADLSGEEEQRTKVAKSSKSAESEKVRRVASENRVKRTRSELVNDETQVSKTKSQLATRKTRTRTSSGMSKETHTQDIQRNVAKN